MRRPGGTGGAPPAAADHPEGSGSAAAAPVKPQSGVATSTPKDSHASAATPGGKDDRFDVMKPARIMDLGSDKKNTVAYTLMIPTTWKLGGGSRRASPKGVASRTSSRSTRRPRAPMAPSA
jgi:hypothetical protein